MQFSAVLNKFIVKTQLNSIFTNDLKRKYFFFEKNVHIKLTQNENFTWYLKVYIAMIN